MPNASSNDTARRLQALIERETGAPLGAAVQAEMAAILGGGPAAARPVAPEVAQVAQREVTIVLADLRGFTALSGAQPAAVVIAALLERGEAIRSPGGYLRNLTEKAVRGKFSIFPMLDALERGKGG